MTAKVRDRADVLAEIHDVAIKRGAAKEEEKALYARQVELYVEAREALDPPLKLKEIADAAGATVVAVDAAIAKHTSRRTAS